MQGNPYTPINPSSEAIKRVSSPLPVPTVCDICRGNHVELKHHESVYGGKVFAKYPWSYVCNDCGARVGLHPDTNIPLGTLADHSLRERRTAVKEKFIAMLRDPENPFFCGRTGAYTWLAGQMGIAVGSCHFGWFGHDELDLAEQILDIYRGAEQ